MAKNSLGKFLALLLLCPVLGLADTSQSGGKVMDVDLAVVGPGGSVIIYYKDGNDIVIRNCGTNYPVINKRSDCATVGQENRVTVATFKRILKSEFEVVDADKLKPLSPEELKVYREKGKDIDPLKQKEKELTAKLARIKAFINTPGYGSDSSTKQDLSDTQTQLDSVRQELTGAKKGQDAIRKINTLVDDLVDKEIASTETKPFVASVAQNGDQARYNLLKRYDSSRPECGTDEILNGTRQSPSQPGAPVKGREAAWLENIWIASAYASNISIGQRIQDCGPIPGSTKNTSAGVWSLVARKRDRTTGQFYEVWKDPKTQLLWGDKLDSTYSHYNAVELSGLGKVVAEKACASDEAQRSDAGLTAKTSGKSFGLPSIQEYQQAENDGIRDVLPNMDHWFWSASLDPNFPGIARVFFGYYGFSGYDGRDGKVFGPLRRPVGVVFVTL